MAPRHNTAIICFSPYFGGMEMDAFRIAKLLSNSIDITLIVKHNSLMSARYRDEAEKYNIRVETIKFTFNLSPSIILKTRKLIKTNNIKNIIFFGASEMLSLYFAFIGLNINLIIRHGTTKSSSKKDILHRLLYSDVNYHIAICKHIAKNVEQIIPLGKNSKIKVIYSSLRHAPDNLPAPKYHSQPLVTLLHVARITDGKGQIDTIKACETLFNNHIPFKLIFLGEVDPNFKDEFYNSFSTLSYSSSIIVPGYTTSVSDYYKSANIFIFPSKGEGLSNSFIEALSYGLVCISYNNTSFPELAQAGFDFFMAENGNIDDLKSCLLKAIDYINTNKIPILHNIKLAQRLFSDKKEMNELLTILD